VRFGVVIVAVTVLSLIYSLSFLPGLFLVVGPTRRSLCDRVCRGEVRPWPPMWPAASAPRPQDKDEDVLSGHVLHQDRPEQSAAEGSTTGPGPGLNKQFEEEDV